MIIELIVGASVVALGAMALRRMNQRRENVAREERAEPREGGGREPATAPEASAAPSSTGLRPPTPRGLRVGDVLLHADTEIWLAGEVHLDEEGFALSIFPTPGARRSSFVAQMDAHAREIALLSPTNEVPGGRVPTELPVGGLRYALRRRGQALVKTAGEHLPLVTERCDFVLLGAPGGRALVVVDFVGGSRLALVGEIVPKEMYDLLPGGDQADA